MKLTKKVCGVATISCSLATITNVHAGVWQDGRDLTKEKYEGDNTAVTLLYKVVRDGTLGDYTNLGTGTFISPNVILTVGHNYMEYESKHPELKNKITPNTTFYYNLGTTEMDARKTYIPSDGVSTSLGTTPNLSVRFKHLNMNQFSPNKNTDEINWQYDFNLIVVDTPMQFTSPNKHAEPLDLVSSSAEDAARRGGYDLYYAGYMVDFHQGSRNSLVKKEGIVPGNLLSVRTITNYSADVRKGVNGSVVNWSNTSGGGFSGATLRNSEGNVVGVLNGGYNGLNGDNHGLIFNDKTLAWIRQVIKENQVVGWKEHQGKRYYFQDNGHLYRSTTQIIDGEKWTFDEFGVATKDESEKLPELMDVAIKKINKVASDKLDEINNANITDQARVRLTSEVKAKQKDGEDTIKGAINSASIDRGLYVTLSNINEISLNADVAEKEKLDKENTERLEKERREKEDFEKLRVEAIEKINKAALDKLDIINKVNITDQARARLTAEVNRIQKDGLNDIKGSRDSRAVDSALYGILSLMKEISVDRDVLEKEKMDKENVERNRLEKEKLAREKAEREKTERERLEKERLAGEQAEKDRLEKERLEKERQEADRIAREKAEKVRLKKERLERERQEADKIAREKAEKDRLEKESLEKEKQEADRLAREKAEKDRLEKERLERERQEADRLAREKAERERLEKECLAREEADRLAREKAERERLEREKQEADRIEREKAEKDRLEKERLEKERQEADRIAREKAEKDRLEKERLEKERQEADRLAREKAERDRLEKERLEREKQEADRLAREKAEKDRLEKDRVEKEHLGKERYDKEEADRIAREKAEKDRVEKERLEKEQQEVDRLTHGKAESERFKKSQNETNKTEKEDTDKLIKEQADHNKENFVQYKLIPEEQSKDRLISNTIKDESMKRDKSKIIDKEKVREIKENIHLNNVVSKNDNVLNAQTSTNSIVKKLPETGNSDYSILGAMLTLLGFSAVRCKNKR